LRAAVAPTDDDRALALGCLGDLDPRTRVLAVRAAALQGWLDLERWRAALSDTDENVRRETVTQLARAGAPTMFDELERALGDIDPLVAEAAAYALGEREVHDAVGRLVEMASAHVDARCREAAVAALGVLGDDAGRAVVLGALMDKPNVRRRAVVALSNFEGPDVDAALLAARDDRDWQVRAAVDLLGREIDD
jgi:HEAT repeat protein